MTKLTKALGHQRVNLRNAHGREVDCQPEKVPMLLASGEFKFLAFGDKTKKELSTIAEDYGFDTKIRTDATTEEVDKKTGEKTLVTKTKTREMNQGELAAELLQRDRQITGPHLPPAKRYNDPKNKLMRMAFTDAGLI